METQINAAVAAKLPTIDSINMPRGEAPPMPKATGRKARKSKALSIAPVDGTAVAEKHNKKSRAPAKARKARQPGEPRIHRIVTVTKDISHYVACQSAAGNASFDCGDKIAKQLRGMELGDVYAFVAQQIGTTQAELVARYSALNAGQQRMNLGNRLRGFLKRQEAAASK